LTQITFSASLFSESYVLSVMWGNMFHIHVSG
jgi:hypothetical protein